MIKKASLMEFRYNPITDVLRVKLPDFNLSDTSEVEEDFLEMRETIKTYFVRRLLIDSVANKQIPDKEKLQWEIRQFMIALAGTSIVKVARLKSASPERENKIEMLTQKIKPSYFLNIQYQNFDSEEEAMEWLSGANFSSRLN